MLSAKTTQMLKAVQLAGATTPEGAFLINQTVNLVYRLEFVNIRLLRELLELREYKRQREGRAKTVAK